MVSKSIMAKGKRWTTTGNTVLSTIVIFLSVGVVACQGIEATPRSEVDGKADGGSTNVPGSKSVPVDRITYVGPNGDLFTINPDGTNQLKLTGASQAGAAAGGVLGAPGLDLNNFYAWPTWSPDGTKLAASRVQVTGQRAEVTLEVIEPGTGRATTLFKNETPALVADGAPHYIYWAPDSKSLAFLASTPDGLTLYVGDTETATEPSGVETGAPLYFQWAGNSNSILVHVGGELKLVTRPFGVSSQSLLPADLGFRAPALSPDGKRMGYVGSAESVGFLMVGASDAKQGAHRALEVGIRAAFAWSPKGGQLAVADQDNPRAPTFQRLRVVAEDGSEERTLAEGHIMAFYWSPSGDQLAWVTLDVEDREFVWWAGPLSGGEAHMLFKFQPSSEVLMMLSFFDQYAYSHSPWSPDGSRLVVAGVRGQPSERRNGDTPTGARIFVLQADGSAEPRGLASGALAFWSWN